ncbi:MAG: hypothetical protein WDN49_26910 [Acetobacteraceae bacterium]
MRFAAERLAIILPPEGRRSFHADFVECLFEPSAFTPHGFCLLWEPGLIWLHAVSERLIGLAYFSIPLALLHFVRHRHDFEFRWMLWLFAAFILACGATHFLSIVTLWAPLYWLEGGVKLITALVRSPLRSCSGRCCRARWRCRRRRRCGW